MRIKIIAEVGVNHNGDTGLALELINEAEKAGADFVKFQTFNPDALVTGVAQKAIYQRKRTSCSESQIEMLRRLALPQESFFKLKKRCDQLGVKFLSTPFDIESLEFLVANLLVNHLKVPSGAITHGPLLLAAAKSGLPIILSTGMSTLEEIGDALGAIAFGLAGRDNPSLEAFRRSDKSILADRVTLLHCTTEYPAPISEINLHAMGALADRFALPVGYSDHTKGINISIAAAALGATVIEKHFTLDRKMAGPDHSASLEPQQFSNMVAGIRDVEVALGSGEKRPSQSELINLVAVRPSLVAACSIRAGELYSEQNLAIKRPGGGLSPMAWWDHLGQVASRDYVKDDLLE